MENKVIILISGKKGTGKSYLAKDLEKELSADRLAFASPLKNMSRPLIEELGFDFDDVDQKEMFRPILQAVGNAGRTMDENFWVNKAVEKAEDSDRDVVIIDDCRYVNELKAFDDFHKVIKIQSRRTSVYPGQDNDPSETGLDGVADSVWDIIFYDKTDHDKLVARVKAMIEKAL